MLVLAGVGPGDRVVDLGCGDGRILVAAARRGAAAIGIDLDPRRVRQARSAAHRAGLADRVRIDAGDLFAADLSAASVVALHLLPHVNRLLEAKLRCELAPGARVVGYAFAMPGWEPSASEAVGRQLVYLWRR